ncbi:SH3 domain-containing protein [bacterium]|nr:MAG: SH3 domain-containing protein [bacterium]
MNRWVAMASGGIGLALAAAVLAETTFALGTESELGRHWRSSEKQLKIGHWQIGWKNGITLVTEPSVTPSATPAPTLAPTPTIALTVTPVKTPSVTPRPVKTARTNAFVHVRAGASTSTAVLLDLNGGTVVELLDYQDTSWQQVRYGSVTGYIFRSYLTY